MKLLPTLTQITVKDQLNAYSEMYFKCSGLPIPLEYLTNPLNRVFAIFWKGAIIGGFILGRDTKFRTIQFFAKKRKQAGVIAQLGDLKEYTEITCFWIQSDYRTNTYLNIFVWLSMTYALRMYGTKFFLFGTCSKSLAQLYGQTSKSILIHLDSINDKSTFIFKAYRSSCVTGMFEIIGHKVKRTIKTIETPKAFTRVSNLVRSGLGMNTMSHS